MIQNASIGKHLSQFKLSKITLKNLAKFDLSPTAKLVLLALVDCYNPNNDEIFPKQSTIADELGISLKSVQRAIKELATAQVIIYETKSQNKYKLTPKFFELLNLSYSSGQIDSSKKVKLSHAHVHEQNKLTEKEQNSVLPFKLTAFQAKYADVFEKLSGGDLAKYKSLQGYEKENWLKAKRRELFQQKQNNELKQQLQEVKQDIGSPLDFDREQAQAWLFSLPEFAKNGYFANEIRQKWGL